MHDLALSPSTWTVHAPQLLVSQPMCVPVSPKSSRRRWTSRRRGSTSASRASPLTVRWTVLGGHRALPPTRTPARARRRCAAPGRSSPRPSPACSRPARGRPWPGRLVRPRPRRPPGRPPRSALAPTSAASRVGRRERGLARPPVRPIAGVARSCRPAASRTIAATADRREVARPALELGVGAAAARRPARDPDLGQDLGRLDGRLERVEEEVARGDRALAGRAPADDRRARRRAGPPASRTTGRRGRTEPPIVPQLRTCGIADPAGRVVEQRVAGPDRSGPRGSAGGWPGRRSGARRPSRRSPSSPSTSRMSTRRPGWASRSLSSGSRL